MKKLLALSLLLSLGMAGNVWAGGITSVQSSTTPFQITATVYNDSGGDLTSGSVVIWDNDDTEFDRTGYPYVTTTTTADHDHPAGVTLDPNCPAGGLCEIVIYGWARTRVADSTDAITEDTSVATSGVAGQAGDWGGGANTCALGMALEQVNLDTGLDSGTDNMPAPIFVNVYCED